MALVPLDVKKRKLVVGRGDRSAVPDRPRPKAREDQAASSSNALTNRKFLRKRMVSLTFASWNQIAIWLRGIDEFRRVA